MITVLIQSESHYPVSREKIRDAVITALEKKVKSDTEVSVSIIGDRLMKQLNTTYRKLNKTTDVLSFPQQESDVSHTAFISPPDNILRLGDIVISYPQAVLEAQETDKLVDDIVVELALHGLDHLLGIHHPE